MSLHRALFHSVRDRLRAAARVALPFRYAWFVACDVRSLSFISECADCLTATREGRRESSRNHPGGVVIPYCGNCLSRIGRAGVQTLAWRLASVLLGLGASAFVPMLPWLTKPVAVIFAAFIACLPWLTYVVWLAIMGHEPSREVRRVIPLENGLACLNQEWASRVAHQLGTQPLQRRVVVNAVAQWSAGGVLLTVILSPWLHDAFHPQLRLLNLTEDTLVIRAEEHFLAQLEPTSSEDPRAGVLIRVASGQRQLEARRADGSLVGSTTADLLLGRTHLFAPSRPKNVCFWLEYARVGRSNGAPPQREPLSGGKDFWVLPDDVDNWFSPAPRSDGNFATGGVVASLRQGACSRADE